METLSMADHLKRLTHEEHQVLEGKVVRLIKGTKSLPDYQRLLRFFYGFYQPVEDILLTHIDETLLPDIQERRKSLRLKADLQATGYHGHGFSGATELPDIVNIPAAFGAMYVLEGSTIGGHYILDLLRRQMDLPGPDGITFFSGYGPDTMHYWAAFKSVINNRFKSAHEIQEVIASARQTFKAFSTWADLNGNYAGKKKL